jgi:uncharacterized protein (DUF362 family)
MSGNRHDNSNKTDAADRGPKAVSRRDFLEQSVGLALTVGIVPACSSSSDNPASSAKAGAAGSSAIGHAGVSGEMSVDKNFGFGGSGGDALASAGAGNAVTTSTTAGATAYPSNSAGAQPVPGSGGETTVAGAGAQPQFAFGGARHTSAGLGGTASGGRSTGTPSVGGKPVGGGGSNASGMPGSGGRAAAGSNSTAGGTPTTGGTAAGGKTHAGGSAAGGTTPAAGGNATGGNATGGNATGGNATGGNATGGNAAGGNAAGGSGSSTGTALVGIVRDSSVATAVADAVAIAGGMPSLSGKTVLIKPNVVWAQKSPYTTSASVVSALIDMVKARGATKVIVADRSDTTMSTTASSFAVDGIDAVVAAAGAQLVDLQTAGYTVTNVPTATNWPNGIPYANTVLSGVDYIINVPCCKDHLMANYTAAIKNWMGIIDLDTNRSDYGRYHAHGNSPEDLGTRLPELHLRVREDLVVMDATNICLTQGPFGPGETAAPGIIVASKDPIAVDVTALCLLKHYLNVQSISNAYIDDYTVWTQPQIVHAMALGIGMTSQQAFNYLAKGVSEISTIMSHV